MTFHTFVACAMCVNGMDIRLDRAIGSVPRKYVEDEARSNGWSRTKMGWVCGPACREKAEWAAKEEKGAS